MVSFQFDSFANTSNALVAGKVVAIASLGIYAGTALSFSTIIMPSLRKFSSNSSVAIWHEAFKAGNYVQTSAIAVSVLGNAGLYYKTKNPSYLYSAVIMALSVPYTFIAVMPVNKKLVAIREENTIHGKSNTMKDPKSNDNVAEALLSRWSLLHAVRTAMGYGALLATVYGVISDRGVRFILFK
ncbi:hypothetical protein BC939DRAFT_458979 [Gamsiella multidivaricata]|uniref:uncharacterized protein n=1 Tax=Gamsiella multidivaricata TaxID=101098 RepID=UPI00221ED04E|nr:uncharacterized protein BC939DRAFT_458979 [Gamsiella multidivaricata]KAG0361334.1 hypothetical protein BGZ54_009144 [Gamsiella multidivaricata]KAI7819919.1 hypothetical protein BC939DRAFT_458979 [Gamsiella multidivaricata]